ncbi:MAG: phosphoglucosamine mutase, partial [Promethearchaeota archaeon]
MADEGFSILKFTTNGIRGIANKDLTPNSCVKIGQSIGIFLKPGANVIIGSDYRISGSMIKSALVSGLLSTGINVRDAGYTPTPALQKYVKDKKIFNLGLIITASHNPPEFNGIKVIDSDGIELPPTKEKLIEKNYNSIASVLKFPAWNEMGTFSTQEGVVDHYVNSILEHVTIDKAAASKIHVVVDPGNGIASSYYKNLLTELGVKVSSIFDEPDGTFPNRVSEPTPVSLTELEKKVVEEDADFGIGFDGDGDRAIFIDDKGRFHWGDESFGVILNDLLQDYKGWVVTPVSSSLLVQEVVQSHGAKLEWT